jgi:hypothetical protein
MFLERLRKYIFGDNTTVIRQRVLARRRIMMASQAEKNDAILRLERLVEPIFDKAYRRKIEGGDCFEVSKAEMADLQRYHEIVSIVSGEISIPNRICGMKLIVKESLS